MVHKITKTQNHLLVLGKNYKSDSFSYIVAEKLTTGEYQVWQVDNPNDCDEPNQFEILAYLPLNGSPVLEGVPLLPPIEDDVEEIAESMLPEKGTFHRKWVKMGIIAGYNKAKKKYKYTEEDMRKAFIAGESRWGTNGEIDTEPNQDDFIQSLHQYPTEFETEDVKDYSSTPKKGVELSSFLVPKTIITDQGVQWVGKYL